MEKNNLAKTVILTSLLSVLIIIGIAFISRNYLFSYLEQRLPVATPPVSATSVITRSAEDPVVSVIEKVNPAVVSVVVTKDVPVYERYYESYDPLGMFGGFRIPRVRQHGTEEQEVGGGSGFIVSNDGLIVTNRHVVEDETAKYSILLNDGTSYPVDVLARDPQLDVAVLKIAEPLKDSLTYVTFGDSKSLRLGETVIAIGNALAEFRNSVSVGVVSGLARSIVASDNFGRSEALNEVIQTDAAINPGNSGGPLLNLQGKVIGINVATSRGANNIGFALPAHVIKDVVESVKKYGEIVRPFLGVRYKMITNEMAKTDNLPVDYGALVVRGQALGEVAVVSGSPADKAGITESTIILSIDDEELRDTDLMTVLRSKQVGQTVKLRVLQAGEEKTVSVTLDKAL